MRSSLVNRFFALSLAAAVGFTGTDVSALVAVSGETAAKKTVTTESVEYVLKDFEDFNKEWSIKENASLSDIMDELPTDLKVYVEKKVTVKTVTEDPQNSGTGGSDVKDKTKEDDEEKVKDQKPDDGESKEAGNESSEPADKEGTESGTDDKEQEVLKEQEDQEKTPEGTGSQSEPVTEQKSETGDDNSREDEVAPAKSDEEEKENEEIVARTIVLDEHRTSENEGDANRLTELDNNNETITVDLSELAGLKNDGLKWSMVESHKEPADNVDADTKENDSEDNKDGDGLNVGDWFRYELENVNFNKLYIDGEKVAFDAEKPSITVKVTGPARKPVKKLKGGITLLAEPTEAADITKAIRGQIHWNDTDFGWNELIRPAKPDDPNTYINLWEYTGETTEGAVQRTLQSADPSAPYYCVITPTEGTDYWTYSIGNIPTTDANKFYTTGPAFTGYQGSGPATQKEVQGSDGEILLDYIEYNINYCHLNIHVDMKPASDTGTIGVNVKLGVGDGDPSINYTGKYSVNDKDNNTTPGTASNGNITNIGHNSDITLTQIPEGVKYAVTATGTDNYIVKYDGKETGVAAAGTSTTITNLSNNARATLTKKWNDNMDEKRSEEKFKESLVLEYRLDSGDYIEVNDKAAKQLGIDGKITFEIEDRNNVWEVKALHGDKENFPAVYEENGNVISYRIVEKKMEGYVSSTDENGVITNTKATEFNAKVNWYDIADATNRPETATYDVHAYYINGTGQQVTLDNDFLARYGIVNGQKTLDTDSPNVTQDIKISGIPMFSDDGYQIVYSVQEVNIEGYVSKYDNKDNDHGTNTVECYDGGEINNTRIDRITYEAKKIWIDGGNEKERPLSTVYLYRYVEGEEISTAAPVVFIDAQNASHVINKKLPDDKTKTEMDVEFSDLVTSIGSQGLYKYDEKGREYIYFVKECLDDKYDDDGCLKNEKYLKSYTDKDGKPQDVLFNGGTLTNSHIPMVDLNVTKMWVSAGSPASPTGTTVQFKIKRKAAGEGSWAYVQDGTEDMVVTLTGFASENLTVNQTVTLPMCNDNGNFYEYQLEEVSVTNGGDNILSNNTMTLDEHTYTFSTDTLDMAQSSQMDSAATEDNNASATLTGRNTISDQMDYRIDKVWQGIDNPTDAYSATMKLVRYDYQGNQDTNFNSDNYICMLDTGNSFTHTFKGLPVYDSNGYQYIYRANETAYTAPEGEEWSVHYTYSYDKTKKLAITTATNYIAGGDTHITVTKSWKDDDDNTSRQSVEAQVYDSDGNPWKGKTVTLSESNGWTGEIGFSEAEIEKLDAGITVAETRVNGFAVNYDGDTEYTELKSQDRTIGIVRTGETGYIYKVENAKENNRSFKITNTRIGKTNVRLTKKWIDGSRDNNDRPEFSIKLSKDGTQLDTVYTVSKTAVSTADTNEWVYTIENLDKYDENGKLIEYTISEVITDELKADHYVSKLETGEFDTSGSSYHSGDIRNYILTNQRKAETQYKVYKKWKDPETTTRRPDIAVELYYSIGDSEDLYKYRTGPLADDQDEEPTYRWDKNHDTSDTSYDSSCTVGGLMMYSPIDGAEIHYYSMETMQNRGEYVTEYCNASGKVVEGQSYAANGELIVNRCNANMNLKGIKYWNNMQPGTKVDALDTSGVKISLYRYLGNRPADFLTNTAKYKVDEITLKDKSTDNKSFAFSNVPKYDSDGKLYTYEMLETIDGKLGFVYNMDPNGYAITNSFITGPPNNRTISVQKTWNAEKYITELASTQTDFKFPDITFDLYRSAGKTEEDNDINFDKPYATITIKSEDVAVTGNTGVAKASFPTQLIWSENGVQYKYAVKERIGDGILPAYSVTPSNKTVLINDEGNEYGIKAEEQPGAKTAEFTNTYEPQNTFTLKGNKIWKDENLVALRPKDIKLDVYRKANGSSDSTAIGEQKLADDKDYTVNWISKGDNTWEYEITGNAISEFAPNGQRWVYTVKEVQKVETGANKYDLTGNYKYSGDAAQNGNASGGVQNMKDITNTLNGEFTVSKTWADNNNEYALRPTIAVVALRRKTDKTDWAYVTTGNNTEGAQSSTVDGTGNVLSHQLTASEKWSHTFKNLAPNDANGNPYTYEGVEIAVGTAAGLNPCITTTITDTKETVLLAGSYRVTSETTAAGTKLTNTLDPTKIIVTKEWVDNDNPYDSRPKNTNKITQITVKLQRALATEKDDESKWSDVTDTSGKLVTKNLTSSAASPSWEIANLPKCDYAGREYVYRAVEITDKLAQAYTATYQYSVAASEITNTLIKRDTETITASKVWHDGNSASRPSSVTFELTRWINGAKVEYPSAMTIVLDGIVETEQNDSYGEKEVWKATWTNLPKQDNQGNEITYKVEEIKIGDTAVADGKAAGYLVQKTCDEAGNNYTFTNVEATQFEVTKTFANDQYTDLTKRPTNVTVKLQRTINGTDWADVMSGENAVTGVIQGFNQNTNTKSYTFTDLPKYDANDNLYTYRAIETKIGTTDVVGDYALGYDVTYDNTTSGKTAVTNTLKTVNITGYKTWDDQNNFYSLRPTIANVAKSNLKVELVVGDSDTKVTKQPNPVWESTTDSNVWKFTFTGLPLLDSAGNHIAYKVKETASNIGYSAAEGTALLTGDFSAATHNATITVTNGSNEKGIVNSLVTVNVTGKKAWSDTVNGSGYNYRPDSITLALKNGTTTVNVPDGKLTWDKTTNKDKWTYTYSDLPKFSADGTEITYTVQESSVTDLGYTPSYDTAKRNITNTFDKKTLTATKVWDDQKNKYNTRPSGWNNTTGSGIFSVYSSIDNGTFYTKMTTQPNCIWTNPSGDEKNYVFTAENLQKWYIKDGTKTEILYKIQEDTVPSNYTSSINGSTITNTLKVTNFAGKKVWVDNSNAYGTRPTALTLTLQRTTDNAASETAVWETVSGNPVVTWTNNDTNHNEWSFSYTGLPAVNSAGTTYTYRVKETVPTGYHTSADTAMNNGTLTNTFDYGSLSISKVFGEQMNNGTADKPLATFTIKDEAKAREFVVKTDKNGKLVQDTTDGSYTDVNGNKFWLITGSYTIKETAVADAADGTKFATDTTVYNFSIAANGGSATVSNATKDSANLFVNNPVRGKLTVQKTDAKYVYSNGVTIANRTDDKKTLLSGAVFKLYLDEAGKNVIATLVESTTTPGTYELPAAGTGTNSLGISYLTSNGLLCGTYYIKETTAPTGYTSLNLATQVTISPNASGNADKTVEIQNTLIEKPFKISKTYEAPNLNAWDSSKAKINADGTSTQGDADHKFTFTVERIFGNTPAFKFKKTVTTDENGIADFGNLPYGEYSVTEADTDPYVAPYFGHIIVDSNGVKKAGSTTVLSDGVGTAYNKLKRGKIAGTKIDTTSVSGQSKPVAGAVMGLYSGDTLLAKAATDADGKYEFTNIPYGSYVVREVKAPANYTLSETQKAVSITGNGQEISLTGDNAITDAPAVAELKLHKVDNETGNVLQNVSFTLTGKDFMKNDITKTGITSATGDLTLSAIPVGTYTLTETKVDNYEKPDSFNITVSNSAADNSNNAVIAVEKVAASDGATSSVTANDSGVYTVTNTRIRRNFAFDKTGTDDELDFKLASKLEGAKFTIYKDEDCTKAFTDNIVTTPTVTSDSDGKVTFKNLSCGTYYIKETKAPANYQLDTKVYSVEVKQDGSVISELKTLVNEAVRGTFEMTKVDANNPEKKLGGSKYKIYKFNQQEEKYEGLSEAVTDYNGKVKFENLLIGEKYRIEEVEAPAGYQVSKMPIEFKFVLNETKDGATLVLTDSGSVEDKNTVSVDELGNIIWHEPPTVVEITKTDTNGAKLAGAQLRLTDENGNVVRDADNKDVAWTSGNKAHSVTGILVAGKEYTLTETKAPEGYQIAKPVKFKVDEKKVGPDGVYVQEIKMVDEKIPPEEHSDESTTKVTPPVDKLPDETLKEDPVVPDVVINDPDGITLVPTEAGTPVYTLSGKLIGKVYSSDPYTVVDSKGNVVARFDPANPGVLLGLDGVPISWKLTRNSNSLFTGDDSNMPLDFAVMMASLAALMAFFVDRKRRKNK